jgi:hypothetical protein
MQSVYKSTTAIFSSSLPICPVYFHLLMPRHVLSPCYARYEHTRGIKGYVTYYLACCVRLQVPNMPYCMSLRVQYMHGCHLRKYEWGKWAEWRKNSSHTFVLTAFISFGLFNVSRTGNFFADFPYLVCSLTVSFRCSSLQHLKLPSSF